MAASLTAKDLLFTEGILTCYPSDSLGQALAKLNSSHDAVFVVDKKNALLGLISPYYAIYKSNLPPTTKLANCLFSPPKLKLNTPIWEIARDMVQSKVYFLPVIADNGRWEGMVSVRSLLQAVVKDKELVDNLQFRKKPRGIITIQENAKLNQARALLRNGGVSRLPVVDSRGKLVGILTRFDLRTAFSAPKTSQRFLSRQGEKKKHLNRPIRDFYKRQVFTASPKASPIQMLNMMLDQRIGSVIVVNLKWQPVQILSYRDVLEAIAAIGERRKQRLSISSSQNFDEQEACINLIKKLNLKLRKKAELADFHVFINVQKNPANRISRFAVRADARSSKGETFVGTGQDYDWRVAVRQAIERVERQMGKS